MKTEFFAHIGIRNKTLPIPFFIIKRLITTGANKIKNKEQQFSHEKRSLQHFIVKELPNIGKSMSLAFLARALNMPRDKVQSIVEVLEKKKIFIYRYKSDSINWAYPITVDKTPHHVTFSTGEQVYAA